VLAFNALSSPLKDALLKSTPLEYIPVAVAAIFTAFLHLWKHNSLISIFGGIVAYTILNRVLAI
jgi:branched-subunit amino acid transport protein AzlD